MAELYDYWFDPEDMDWREDEAVVDVEDEFEVLGDDD
jgi:hypothetical protein